MYSKHQILKNRAAILFKFRKIYTHHVKHSFTESVHNLYSITPLCTLVIFTNDGVSCSVIEGSEVTAFMKQVYSRIKKERKLMFEGKGGRE